MLANLSATQGVTCGRCKIHQKAHSYTFRHVVGAYSGVQSGEHSGEHVGEHSRLHSGEHSVEHFKYCIDLTTSLCLNVNFKLEKRFTLCEIIFGFLRKFPTELS